MTSRGVMTPGEVAALFRVDPKTPVRWAKAGRIPSFKTPGGQRRFRTEDVLLALQEAGGEAHDPLLDYTEWVVSLDEPGNVERRRITLNEIIDRARYALKRLEED